MARTRAKNSKLSYKGFGLTPEEDKKLIAYLKKADLSAAQLVRGLIRDWIQTQE